MELNYKILEYLNTLGYETEEELSEFLSDKPRKTYDPFLLLNMDAGVDLILSAIEDDETICVYGDYDADGITSVTLLTDVLSELTEKVFYYIPSRFDEGYGLNRDAILRIREAGADAVVTVDCGSVSGDEVRYARELGMKVLVTDHHTVVKESAAECPLINPIQEDCPYPFSYLAGVGVALKLAQALVDSAGLDRTVLTRNLDLVGIGTIGDIVPLVDENRTWAKYGIRMINLGRRKGLRALMEAAGLKPGSLTAEQISYVIVPHLNAAGRMEDASIAVELLKTEDDEKARTLAAKLVELNRRRKDAQEKEFMKCARIAEERYGEENLLLIEAEDAHEGITGIVAGKLKERFGKPAIIVTPTEDGCLKGTGRSVDDINIFDLLNGSRELFTRFGGHRAACGFTIKRELLPELRENLKRDILPMMEKAQSLSEEKPFGDIYLDTEEVSLETTRQLAALAPFGRDNPQPEVAVSARPKYVKRIGKDGKYLSFTAELEDGRELRCVDFKNPDDTEKALVSQTGKGAAPSEGLIGIKGYLGSQTWNGKTYIQMIVTGVD